MKFSGPLSGLSGLLDEGLLGGHGVLERGNGMSLQARGRCLGLHLHNQKGRSACYIHANSYAEVGEDQQKNINYELVNEVN